MLRYNDTVKKAIRKNIKSKESWIFAILTSLPFIIIALANYFILKEFNNAIINIANEVLQKTLNGIQVNEEEVINGFLVAYSNNQTSIFISTGISVLSIIISALVNVFIYHFEYCKINGKKYEIKETLSFLWGGFCLEILKSVIIFLFYLLFIIPGIIKSLSYSMSMFIKIENPNLKAKACINKSKEMMEGRKERLFIQWFSYLLYAILTQIIAGVAQGFITTTISIFSQEISLIVSDCLEIVISAVTTYLLVSVYAVFYDEIKRDEEYLNENPELKEKGINVVLREDDEVRRNVYVYQNPYGQNPNNQNYNPNSNYNNPYAQQKPIDPFDENNGQTSEKNENKDPFEE